MSSIEIHMKNPAPYFIAFYLSVALIGLLSFLFMQNKWIAGLVTLISLLIWFFARYVGEIEEKGRPLYSSELPKGIIFEVREVLGNICLISKMFVDGNRNIQPDKTSKDRYVWLADFKPKERFVVHNSEISIKWCPERIDGTATETWISGHKIRIIKG